ncbi:hypothetical protein [Mycobacterium asiaticum]|uniref:hypothetical protein n=1 Tax=Mycobacterium asiaticum TaxID=1790 RepID=UPI0007EF0FC8|nr:hypothetical protein [Mycobacterium asiaticum]OBJ58223.1 hypothetical protein A9W94_16865 [Mycobacterium asiaticum]
MTSIEETWTNRDLPVLRALVQIYENTGRAMIRASDIENATGFDKDTTQRALRSLSREPYFKEAKGSWGGGILFVGPPTGAALRVAGQWPTPESMVERLIAAFEAAASDEDLEEPERTRAQKIRDGLISGGSKIAIAALGSAGGHILSS